MVNWNPTFSGVIWLVIYLLVLNLQKKISPTLSRIQWYLISQLLERFCLVYLLDNPATVELSVIIGVLSCLCPNSSNATVVGTDICALRYKAPYSASAALMATSFSNQHSTWTAALCVGFNWRFFLSYQIKRSSLQCDYVLWMLQDRLHHHVPIVICPCFYIKWLIVDTNWDNWVIGCNEIKYFQ